jgi:hypothetical protein
MTHFAGKRKRSNKNRYLLFFYLSIAAISLFTVHDIFHTHHFDGHHHKDCPVYSIEIILNGIVQPEIFILLIMLIAINGILIFNKTYIFKDIYYNHFARSPPEIHV